MTINERIHKEVARECKLRVSDVEKIVKSMFDMLTDAMENGEVDKPIRMQYLGIWECKPKRIEKLKEKGYFKNVVQSNELLGD